MRFRRATVVVGAVLGLSAAGSPATAAGTHVFYLTARTGHCYGAASDSSKTFTLLPCSNARHDLEVYWTGHAGWGTATPSPSVAAARARSVCIAQYERIDHGRYKAYSFFYADPGPETARYHDHLVCAHSTHPGLHPLGAGWHVTG